MLVEPRGRDGKTSQEFLDEAFGYVGLDWQAHVEIDPSYFRPTEVDVLLGDATKAREQLGWQPRVTFPALVRLMVDHDLELARQECTLRNAGHPVMPRGGIQV